MKSVVLILSLVFALGAFAQAPTTTPTQRTLTFWEKVQALFKAADGYLYGDIDSYGLSMRSLGQRSRFSWYGLRNRVRREVRHSPCKDLSCPTYMADLAEITEARTTKAREVEWLIDMPTSFNKRFEMIQNAQKTIHILTWGIYDDITGTVLAEKLLEKLQQTPDIDIRIIVDQKVALLEVHRAVLNKMVKESEGKIKLIRWESTRYRSHANHRKLMVVDQEHIVLGGTNVGDMYSHFAGDMLWRDADAYLAGHAVGVAAESQFAQVWNEQVAENPDAMKFDKIVMPEKVQEDGTIPVQLLDHNPGNKTRKADHNIMSAIYKLIANAKTSVDIENAYFILDPVMRDVLKKAVKRGVKIRLYTNSKASVDVPFLGTFVASSAKKAFGYGVEVYLRQTTTMHSKYMIVDGEVVMIGSHNMHPRSQTVDGENVVLVYDKGLAQELTNHFETGLAEAFHPRQEREIQVGKGVIDFLYGTILFDHL